MNPMKLLKNASIDERLHVATISGDDASINPESSPALVLERARVVK